MDAYVQLALVEKARRVFSTSADTFLSFPVLTPLTMSSEALGAVAAPETNEDFAVAGEFSRMVNFIPRDTVATLDGGRTLWDIYGDVLARADVGTGVADPEDEQRRRNAATTLFTVGADGLRQESAKYRAYRAHRDAWFAAQEDFRSRQLTAESSNDPAVQQRWREYELVLRARIADLENTWRVAGYRDEVEVALAVLETVSAANPTLRWQNWRDAFNLDLDLITAEAGTFAPTGYSPVNLDSDDAWARFEVSADEIRALAAEAPEELRRALADDPDPVTKLEFDYRSVVLTRPWFTEAALTSRLWRMPAGEAPLSDGAAPPAGQCPAFVAALVLMRRLVVHRPSGRSAGEALAFDLPLKYLTARVLPHPDDEVRRWRELTHVMPDFRRPFERVPAHQDLRNAYARVAIHEFDTLTTPVVFDRQIVQREQFEISSVGRSPDLSVAVRQFPTRLNPSLFSRFRRSTEPTIRGRLPKWWGHEIAVDRGIALPIEPVQENTGSSDITILAFICKRLPKTPDPLPHLVW